MTDRRTHFLSNPGQITSSTFGHYTVAKTLSYEEHSNDRYSFLSCAREQMFGIIELTAKCSKLPTDCRQLKIKAVDYQ